VNRSPTTSCASCWPRIDRTYQEQDDSRVLMERSLAISSRELREMSLDMERSSDSLLAHERDRLRLLFDSVTTGLLVIDRFGRITSVNPEAERLFGPASTLLDTYLDVTLSMVGRDGEPRPLLGRDDLDRALRSGTWTRTDIRLVDPRHTFQHVETADGGVPVGIIAADVSIVAFRSGDAHLGGLVVVTDNAIREEARTKLAWQATHDSLTSLPNRSLLAERLEVALVHARRTAAWPSVLFVDLDRFKHVNDSLGHAAGDRLLVIAADRLQRCVRRADTVARTGGDEFVVLCEGAPPAAVRGLAERILATMSEPFDLGGEQAFVSASIGIAHANAEQTDVETLLRDADLAMYRSKQHGGSSVEEADDRLRASAAERVVLERALRSAVHEDQIGVLYQPVFRMETGELVGFEALARWTHPTRGPIPPERFISVAEESGVILAVGDRVLDIACRDLATWNSERRLGALGPDLVVHVNISARELSSPSLVERACDAMRRYGLDPCSLAFDVPEMVLLQAPETAGRRLQELHEVCIGVTIDDFGTGHTSLTSLRQFAVAQVKIDRGLIADIDRSPRDERVVRAVVDLAHALGCQVVAEGVETVASSSRCSRSGASSCRASCSANR
jgi:diguanylate cyclase (GGDEF)-like protein